MANAQMDNARKNRMFLPLVSSEIPDQAMGNVLPNIPLMDTETISTQANGSAAIFSKKIEIKVASMDTIMLFRLR
jgi:hypothetical protein